jgi:hypothetical protein
VLYKPSSPPQPVSPIAPRRRCRHPRCAAKLKQPTDNRLDAFCCVGCFDSYYRSRCFVCERLIAQKTKPRRVCDRQKCRGEFRRHPERFSGARYPASGLSQISLGSAHSTGLKFGQKGDRPFRIVAGPALSSTALRLTSLPLDPEFVARLDRAHATYVENRAKAKRSAARRALIKRRTPPANILGGYKFPGALARLHVIAPSAGFGCYIRSHEWATPSRWEPTGAGADVPPIPEFLRRDKATAAPSIAAEEEPPPCPATAPIKIGTSDEVV